MSSAKCCKEPNAAKSFLNWSSWWKVMTVISNRLDFYICKHHALAFWPSASVSSRGDHTLLAKAFISNRGASATEAHVWRTSSAIIIANQWLHQVEKLLSSWGEIVGICHIRPNHDTPPFISSIPLIFKCFGLLIFSGFELEGATANLLCVNCQHCPLSWWLVCVDHLVWVLPPCVQFRHGLLQ